MKEIEREIKMSFPDLEYGTTLAEVIDDGIKLEDDK